MVTQVNLKGQGVTEYAGLSDDTKPTDGVQINALFLELDTGDFYYFTGDDWVKIGESPDSGTSEG